MKRRRVVEAKKRKRNKKQLPRTYLCIHMPTMTQDGRIAAITLEGRVVFETADLYAKENVAFALFPV